MWYLGSSTRVIAAAGLVLLVACAPLRGRPSLEEPAQDGVSFRQGAIILTGSALSDGPGSLLATMTGKIPNFRVKRNGDRCPDITLRGQTSFQQISNPKVFVDGTRATDTCILESLAAVKVGDQVLQKGELHLEGVLLLMRPRPVEDPLRVRRHQIRRQLLDHGRIVEHHLKSRLEGLGILFWKSRRPVEGSPGSANGLADSLSVRKSLLYDGLHVG